MSAEQETIRCSNCRCERFVSEFDITRLGRRLKTCQTCKAGRERNKCEHHRKRSQCVDCGGASICNHKRRREQCVPCGGSQICLHQRIRDKCRECDPDNYLKSIVLQRISKALKGSGIRGGFHHLGCDVPTFRAHLEAQFTEGMNWENQGEWEIDHIIAILHRANGIKPTPEDLLTRLHYTNTQPLWARDNHAKGNR